MQNQSKILVGLLVVAAFAIGVLFTKVQYLEKNGAQQAAVPAAQAPAGGAVQPTPGKVDVEVGHLPVLGNKNAKVKVIEFADFQCPFCEKWYKDIETNLMKDYVDTGKVQFAFRQYAFLGQESTFAAEASECANEQGKFWEYHHYLYEHQAGENQGAFAKDKLKGFAKELGLDTDKFNTCLDTDKYAKQVTDDLAAGQKAGVNGTPTTFINGRPAVGAQPYATIKQAIEDALAGKN